MTVRISGKHNSAEMCCWGNDSLVCLAYCPMERQTPWWKVIYDSIMTHLVGSLFLSGLPHTSQRTEVRITFTAPHLEMHDGWDCKPSECGCSILWLPAWSLSIIFHPGWMGSGSRALSPATQQTNCASLPSCSSHI